MPEMWTGHYQEVSGGGMRRFTVTVPAEMVEHRLAQGWLWPDAEFDPVDAGHDDAARVEDRRWKALEARALEGLTAIGTRPAFVIGEGPTLPDSLSALDGLFTVGVNRILRRYDPTCSMWLDPEVPRDLGPLLTTCEALLLRPAIEQGPHINRHPKGYIGPPTEFVSYGDSGATACHWCLALGCDPVYAVGMGGRYGVGGKTNWYGVNPERLPNAQRFLRLGQKRLFQNPRIFPILTQEQLDTVCARFPHRPRSEYVAEILQQVPRIRAGQLAPPA